LFDLQTFLYFFDKHRVFSSHAKRLALKKLLLLIPVFLLLSMLKATAMDRWEILFNNKVLYKGSEDQEDNTVHFKVNAFKKTDCFTIRYTAENAQNSWNRTFYINGKEDNNIKTFAISKQSGKISVTASLLSEMMHKKAPVFIYTTSLPKDAAKAAAVRVRRILLCKLEWN
jgi:hypothetical protein